MAEHPNPPHDQCGACETNGEHECVECNERICSDCVVIVKRKPYCNKCEEAMEKCDVCKRLTSEDLFNCDHIGCSLSCCPKCLHAVDEEGTQFCTGCFKEENRKLQKEIKRREKMASKGWTVEEYANENGGFACDSCDAYHEEDYCPYRN